MIINQSMDPETYKIDGSSSNGVIISDKVPICTVIYDYQAQRPDELDLRKGDRLFVTSRTDEEDGWWEGKLGDRKGVFPRDYVTSPFTQYLTPSPLPPEVPYHEIKFIEMIGTGGFGKVWSGVWRDKSVAIKVCDPDPSGVENSIKSVRQEAHLFWVLRPYPNIIHLMAVCLEHPHLCLIMEYARGGTLYHFFLKRKCGLPYTIIVEWSLQIAKGMDYLHEAAVISLVHRDLKSSNILIKEELTDNDLLNKTMKISDFGQARELTKTTNMTAAGTYAWMAPEVIRHSSFSKKSDVWSFGVLFWELLTGQVPYEGLDGVAIAYGVGSSKLSLPIPSSCPESFANLLKACWSHDVHQRPSFKAILNTLEELSQAPSPIDKDVFKTMQVNWKTEIHEEFEKLKLKEKELCSREEEVHRVELMHRMREEELRGKEKELRDREMGLLEKELNLLMKQDERNQQQQVRKPPVPSLRKKLLNKLKNPFHKHRSRKDISSPLDFSHNIAVRYRDGSGSPSPSVSPWELRDVPAVPQWPGTGPALFNPIMPFVQRGRTWGPSSLPRQTTRNLMNLYTWASHSAPDFDKLRYIRSRSEELPKAPGADSVGHLLLSSAVLLGGVGAGFDLRSVDAFAPHPRHTLWLPAVGAAKPASRTRPSVLNVTSTFSQAGGDDQLSRSAGDLIDTVRTEAANWIQFPESGDARRASLPCTPVPLPAQSPDDSLDHTAMSRSGSGTGLRLLSPPPTDSLGSRVGPLGIHARPRPHSRNRYESVSHAPIYQNVPGDRTPPTLVAIATPDRVDTPPLGKTKREDSLLDMEFDGELRDPRQPLVPKTDAKTKKEVTVNDLLHEFLSDKTESQ